jgi:threonine aldolase
LKAITPSNGVYLTLEDVMANVALDDDVHTCPTRVISLENTLNGMVMPLHETQRISKFARDNGVKLHLDGARLWEVAASGEGSLVDFAACFDTISLCFSKGLGAPIGSILIGSKASIKTARWIRKALGGGARQSGVIAAPARVAVEETFGKGPNGEGGLLKDTHTLAKQVEKIWTELGGKLVHPVQTNMVWLDLDAAGICGNQLEELGAAEGLKMLGNRIVLHYQIFQKKDVVLPRLEKVFRRAMEIGGSPLTANGERSQYQSQ